VRRDAGDGDRDVADRELPEAMEAGGVDVGELRADVVDDRGDLLLRHRAIGVVENRLDRLPFAVIADDPFEKDAGAVAAADELPRQGGGVDGIVGEVGHFSQVYAERSEASPVERRRPRRRERDALGPAGEDAGAPHWV